MQQEFRKPPSLWIGCATALVLAMLFALHQLWQHVSRLRDAQVAVSAVEAQLHRTELLRVQSRVLRRDRRSTPENLPEDLKNAEKELSVRLGALTQLVPHRQDIQTFRQAVDRMVRGPTDSRQGEQLFADALAALNDAQQNVGAEARLRALVAQFGTGVAITVLFVILGRLVTLIYVPRRILAEEAKKQALEACEERFQRMNAKSCDVVAILSCDGVIEYVGGGVENVLGHSPGDGLGRNILSLLHPDEVALARQLIGSLAAAPGAIRTEHFHYRHPCSGVRSLEVVVRNELQTEGINGVVVNARDVTDRVQAQERFRHEAFHDSLTGLPNRALFMERLQHAVNRARRDPSYQYAALFLDLDRFKLVNDSFGYSAGDDLLKAFAARLRLCIQGPTTLLGAESAKQTISCEHTLARLGGDEFCVLLEDVNQASAAIRMGERILLRLKDSFFIGQADVFTSASIGVALGSPNYVSADEVIRDADIAMYRAKVAGGARLQLYDEAMHQEALQQLRLETDLRRALERGEFEVAFQPIVLLDNGRLEGVEALIRWRHPQRGLVPPGEFISVAEATGLIVPLGRWMLHESCRQFHSLRQVPGAPSTLSVNFSAQEVSQPDLVDQVKHALESSGLPGDCLHVEITESTMMSNVEQVSVMLLALKELGVRISVDDFGTGYSSLSYLRRLPIDALKIDRSFVLAMEGDQESREIVHTILALARNLGLQTIAEGAETAEQVSQLKQMCCTYGQGYFFSKPVDVDALRQRLQYWPLECPVESREDGLSELEKLLMVDAHVAQRVAEKKEIQPVLEPLRWRTKQQKVPRKQLSSLT